MPYKDDEGRCRSLISLLSDISQILSLIVAVLPTSLSVLITVALSKLFRPPTWLIIAIVLIGVLFSVPLLWRLFGHRRKPIRVIKFNYLPESPTMHGWDLTVDNPNKVPPEFQRVDDGFVGPVLCIQSKQSYYMDFEVSPAERVCRSVEFIAKLKPSSAFYAKVRLQSDDQSSSKDGWLTFDIGRGNPKLVETGMNEWIVYVSPRRLKGDWLLIRINLPRQVKKTFGKSGWQFDRLFALRLRGEMCLANIALYDA